MKRVIRSSLLGRKKKSSEASQDFQKLQKEIQDCLSLIDSYQDKYSNDEIAKNFAECYKNLTQAMKNAQV